MTSDSVGVDATGKRANETPGGSQRFNLDGFEVVDMSSCMYFPKGRSIIEKRLACRPQVYRYRWPSAEIALGHTNKNSIYGCHELEVYANDRLTCGSGGALIMFDMSGAFDDRGTEDAARRQAARHPAAVPGAREHVEPAIHDGRAGHRLRGRHR